MEVASRGEGGVRSSWCIEEGRDHGGRGGPDMRCGTFALAGALRYALY